MKKTFNWEPHWNIETAVEKTIEFAKQKENVSEVMEKQIEGYLGMEIKEDVKVAQKDEKNL